MNLRDLRLRVRSLFRPRMVERELQEELAFHLEREAQRNRERGLADDEARLQAKARFGSAALAADECRDARGTAFLDAAVRDVVYALRTFRRSPLAAVTIVTTVALGLGLVAVVFTIFNVMVFRVDEVRNPHELFEIERRLTDGQRSSLTLPQYNALRRDADAFADSFAMLGDITSRIDGRIMEGTLVSGNFFDALGVRAALGRVMTPADDERHAPRPVMVLSHRGWTRRFQQDPHVVGRTLKVNGNAFEIIGVTPRGFRGLYIGAPDYWAPLSLLAQFRPIHAGRENNIAIDVVGRLKPGMSKRATESALGAWFTGGTAADAGSRPLVRLRPRQGTVPDPTEAVVFFVPIFFVFGLVLAIGCANVASLLLARALSRQREFGIRLALGASRARLVRQLLTESFLLALASAALGFAISRAALEGTLYAVSSTISPELTEFISFNTPGADWRLGVFLFGAAIAATAFVGLAPALHGTRLELVRTMRGELTKGGRPSRARNALIGAQVGASALLLVTAGVFLRSAFASAAADPGFRTNDTLIVEIVNEQFRTPMVQAVVSHPSIAASAAVAPDALSRPRTAHVDTPAGRINPSYRFVSPEYFGVLDIPLLRGRTFTVAESQPGHSVVIVAETLARQMWPGAEAIGQTLSLGVDEAMQRREEPALPGRTFAVVGVVGDVAGFRFAEFAEASLYFPINAAAAETSLAVRAHGDPELVRQRLLERLTPIDPNMGMVMTFRTLARLETYMLQAAFWVAVVLGGLALALTLSGLFSVLSYLVEQRTPEIGVRMALGATAGGVARLVLAQSVRPIALGLLVGGGLAASLAGVLLATPLASSIGRSVKVLDPIAYAASLSCIVAACLVAAGVPALRAARIDPMVTLRHD